MKILIHGDSWGCGTWQKNPTKNPTILLHSGTELFLRMRGHEVTNYSVAGNSNVNVYKTLADEDLNKYDFVFIFFTNPFRDLGEKVFYNQYLDVPDRSITYDRYVEIYKALTKTFYDNLNNLNYPIHLLGGHNRVDTELLNHKNIINLIPSIREMFYPDFKEEQINYYELTFRNNLSKLDIDCVEKLFINKNYMKNFENIQKEYFHPDGYHLNTSGHKILSDYLHEFMLGSNSR